MRYSSHDRLLTNATRRAMRQEPVAEITASFPHCDSEVLHAPGSCEYCDMHPNEQAQRIRLGINFTGEHDPNKTPCPAEQRRNVETINRWGGNVARHPVTDEAVDALRSNLERLRSNLDEDD